MHVTITGISHLTSVRNRGAVILWGCLKLSTTMMRYSTSLTRKGKMRIKSHKNNSSYLRKNTVCILHVFTFWLINIFFGKEESAPHTTNAHKLRQYVCATRWSSFYDWCPQKVLSAKEYIHDVSSFTMRILESQKELCAGGWTIPCWKKQRCLKASVAASAMCTRPPQSVAIIRSIWCTWWLFQEHF